MARGMANIDVFLSYSRKDEEFVKELYRRFVRDGITCFFDQKSIAWGSNSVVAMEKGLRDARHVVLVLSPEFLESQWTEIERTAALTRDPAGRQARLKPLLLTPCLDHLDYPEFLRPIQAIDVSTPELYRAAVHGRPRFYGVRRRRTARPEYPAWRPAARIGTGT